jgi:hypothetical protein
MRWLTIRRFDDLVEPSYPVAVGAAIHGEAITRVL